ncbi:MAG: alpha/beta hydrolase [Bdellovibrio sp.]|nr:alpha/beta hydrolase [Bdellovibrio sp.]
MFLFNFIFFILFHSQASATSGACQIAELGFKKRFTQLEKQYAKYSDTKVLLANQPTWSWGKNKKEVVYLLHGFIGTPEEMSVVAEKLSAENYTVVNDIIPGYGLDGYVANHFKASDWQNHVNANLASLQSCFKKIHLVGFSTGGLLLHHYLRTHPDFAAASITLYSPFYQPNSSFLSLLGAAARFLTPVVYTKLLYKLTRFSDIKVAILKPDHYLQQIPLDAARAVQNFGEQVNNAIKKDSGKKLKTPTLLFIGDGDEIVDQSSTIRNVSADFQNLRIIHFENSTVPHHLMVKEVSSVADEVHQRSVEFILNN